MVSLFILLINVILIVGFYFMKPTVETAQNDENFGFEINFKKIHPIYNILKTSNLTMRLFKVSTLGTSIHILATTTAIVYCYLDFLVDFTQVNFFPLAGLFGMFGELMFNYPIGMLFGLCRQKQTVKAFHWVLFSLIQVFLLIINSVMIDKYLQPQFQPYFVYAFLMGLVYDLLIMDFLFVFFGWSVMGNYHDFREFVMMIKDRGFYEVDS